MFDKTIYENIQCVTMHIKEPIWSEIQRQFITVTTQESNQGAIADIIISKEECLQIAYKYPKYITIIQPQQYVDEFKTHLKLLFESYNI